MRQALVHILLAILGGLVVWMIVLPGRANADPVPMYCGLGPSGQSCAEFPIVTHWVADSGGGGVEQLGGAHADPRRLTEPELRYGHYSAITTDTYAPADWEVIDFINRVEDALGCNPIPPNPPAPTCVPLKLYNYDSETALGKLQENIPYIQVIHNVRILGVTPWQSLFTFIFPPGWQCTRSYPILLSGNGGLGPNNQRLFAIEDTYSLAARVGQSGSADTPLIAALSNAGGREGVGWHQTALDDVASMLTFMRDQGYGVDPFRVVNLGYSRGGGTALLWGENPLFRDYTSIGVFAMEPPSHLGYITQQALASYPFLHMMPEFFNDETADRYGPGQKIDLNPAPISKLMLDQEDPWKADRPQEIYRDDPWRKSPSGYLSFLRNKPVVFSVGTHDAIIPLPMILKLDRTLYHLPHALSDPPPDPIPHLTCLTLRTGHNWDSFTCLRAELSRFLDTLTAGQPYTVPDERRYYQAIDLTYHGQEAVPISPPALPFSIVVPYRMAVHTANLAQWATLAACGESNKSYEARLIREADGQVVYTTGVKTFNGNTFSDFDFDGVGEPDPECDVIRLDQQPNWQSLPTGTYRWRFTYQGQEINAGNLSYFGDSSWGRPTEATTILDLDQPPKNNAIFDPWASINMGIDQF